MIQIFKSNSKISYLTSRSPIEESGEFDVILSPEFYWIKRVSLPVKRVSAAKSLAPSIFESALPSGEYDYEVQKSGDEFIIIAYNKDRISNTLKEKFSNDARVRSLYFAQNEFKDLEGCCGVDQNSSLINLDGLIMQVPRVCTESKKEITEYLDGKNLSKNRISLGALESNIIGKREFYLLSAGVFTLFLSLLLEFIDYKNRISLLDEKRSELISKYNLPETSMQLDSIKKSLTKSFQEQKRVRDEISELSNLSLKDGEYIESIVADTKGVVVTIKVSSSSREEEIKKELSKRLKVKSSSYENSSLTIKIKA